MSKKFTADKTKTADVYLTDLVTSYYETRGLVWPDTKQAYLWLVSEVGELGAALNQAENSTWVRNNDPATKEGPEAELGDVLMMLYVLAMTMTENPAVNMFEKMDLKLAKLGVQFDEEA